jgi:Ca-activated chloride channel family protein
MNRIVTALHGLPFPCFPATAQIDERADTILVLDASGSMWGQIDGVNKIVIAREVIAEVLQDLPGNLDLGLMAYGHNRRGDCSDIEMLIEPGPDTRAAIVEAVNTINPRGRTPMTDAVVAAAQSLRYTENAATVILVSDGIETCEADPCAIAAELEAAGIGFTAHVIGFDVASEPEARAQMQCLAENTGGAFLTADNAEELAAALAQVTAAPPPQTAMATIVAVVEPDGTPPVSVLTWTLSSAAGEVLAGPVEAPGFNVELPAGDYVVEVLRNTQGTRHSAAFTVVAGEDTRVTVPLPALLTPVTFEARLDSADGPLIDDPVLWSFATKATWPPTRWRPNCNRAPTVSRPTGRRPRHRKPRRFRFSARIPGPLCSSSTRPCRRRPSSPPTQRSRARISRLRGTGRGATTTTSPSPVPTTADTRTTPTPARARRSTS